MTSDVIQISADNDRVNVTTDGADIISVGTQGPPGATGAIGATGPGVPIGGTSGQLLFKVSATDFDTAWQTLAAGNLPAHNHAASEIISGLLDTARIPNLPISQITSLQATLDSKQPLNANLTTIAGLTPSANDFLQFVSSAWANRTPSQVKASLAIAAGDVSGLGTMATQNASAVAITGGAAELDTFGLGVTPVAQQAGGDLAANPTYGANEQVMLQRLWTMAQAFGFISLAETYNTLQFQDQFTTPASAPLSSPRTMEPGPGQLTLVQTDGQLSTSAGVLNFPTQATPVFGDQGFYYGTGLTRQAGRMLYVEPISSAGRWGLVWSSTAAVHTPASNTPHAMVTGDGVNIRYAYVNNNNIDLNFVSADLPIGMVLRDTGCWYLGKVSTDIVLMWVDGGITTTPLYPMFENFDGVGTLDNFGVYDFTSVWNNQWGGPITERSAAPSTGQVIDSDADCHIEFTWTPASSETLEIRFRRTDDNNCMLLRCSQGSSTIRLYEVNAGVETERTGGTTSQTWAVGTPVRIVILARAAIVWIFVATTPKNANSACTFNQTVRGSKISGFTTGSNFVSWMYRVTGEAYAALQGFFLT